MQLFLYSLYVFLCLLSSVQNCKVPENKTQVSLIYFYGPSLALYDIKHLIIFQCDDYEDGNL